MLKEVLNALADGLRDPLCWYALIAALLLAAVVKFL